MVRMKVKKPPRTPKIQSSATSTQSPNGIRGTGISIYCASPDPDTTSDCFGVGGLRSEGMRPQAIGSLQASAPTATGPLEVEADDSSDQIDYIRVASRLKALTPKQSEVVSGSGEAQ